MGAGGNISIDLASDIIYHRHSHLSPSTSLSDKLEHDDLTERKLKHMSESNARRNLFIMLIFNIKGFIYLDSIKRSSLTRVDITIAVCTAPLTTNKKIEHHLLQRYPQSYWAAGSTPFGHTPLRQSLGPTGDSPLANYILDGTFTHPNLTVKAFTSHLRQRLQFPDIPKATVTEKQLSRAFGGLREKSASFPFVLYNANYMCLILRSMMTHLTLLARYNPN
jgi:hypothetical protein